MIMFKLLRFCVFVGVWVFLLRPIVAMGQMADSLLMNFYKENNDTSKINMLFKVSDFYHYQERDYGLSEKYMLEAKKVAEATKKPGLIAHTYNAIGSYYRNSSHYSEALKYHHDALNISRQLADSSQVAHSYNNIGVVYRRLDNHAMAAENHIEALRIAEMCGDSFSISVSCNSLGNIFSLNGRYDEAIVYFNKALDISTKSNNKLGMAMNYNNIGEVYEFKHDYKAARELYARSLEMNREIHNQQGIAICYNCLGKIALYEGNARLAYNYFKAAVDIDKQLNNKRYLADGYVNMAKATIALKKYDEAKSIIDKGFGLAKEINSLRHLQTSCENLSNYYVALGIYDLGYRYLQLSAIYKDSILNEKSSRIIASMQALYESEKSESEIKILRQEQEIKNQQFAKQRVRNYMLLSGIAILTALIVGIYISLHNKRRRNRLLSRQIVEIEQKNSKLAEQKEEITAQKEDIIKKKELIEIKNENLERAYRTIETYVLNITDSIRYAEKIQESIQPTLPQIKSHFADTVIFNRPKDIVSGDFYWLYHTPDRLFFALSDCTGHGVPGAFMSIIGIDLLNQAVRQNRLTESDKILSFVNSQLINRLRKTDNDRILMDSMDIAICVLDIKTKMLSFSGTLIPIIAVRNGQIDEIKPDVYSLGSIFRINAMDFKTQTIQLKPNDWLYISSDGYFDQIGGAQKLKYQRNRFKELAKHLALHSGDTQQELLTADFNAWIGSNEQIDDVLVWGLKI